MKIRELQAKGEAELKAELARLKKEVQELSTKLRLGQVKNVRQVRGMRKDIARILTLLKSNQVVSSK
jgi:ribosomal protein L29